MSKSLQNIKHVLGAASQETGNERRVHLEVAGDLMRQYQRRIEIYHSPIEISFSYSPVPCGHCGRSECSH